MNINIGDPAWYIEPPFDLLATHVPCNIATISAKRIALSFDNSGDVPVDLRKRELVVPAHSYGQRFCKRSIEEEEDDVDGSISGFACDLIEARASQDEIYSYAGSQLIAVNLFKTPSSFNEEAVLRYLGPDKHREDNPPHLYAMLNDSVIAAFNDGKPQMHVLLSNGPGTGISFTLSRSLNFLEKAFGTSDVHFSDRITTALYILHTFTNAKMPRNDDSCRASICARLGMHPADRIVCSADVQAYGLEVSRVVFQGPSERNFHIFYQLCAGASDEMKAKYFLEPVENYRYLNRRLNVDSVADDEPIVFEVRNPEGELTVDDANDFLDLMSLLNAVGVQPAKQDHILRTVSAILLVGNIDFDGDEEASIVNPDVVEKVAELLRVDFDTLATSLVSCTRHVVGDDAVKVAYGPTVARRLRDSLAQGLYTALVDLVATSISWRPEDMTATWIGLTVPSTAEFLFEEVIDVRKNYCNRYSQLLRNLMHEVIMNYRMEYTLFVGKEHWQAQGLQDQEVQYEENSAVLEVIGGRRGILALMDELCKQTWLDIKENPLHAYLVRCLQNNECFSTCEDPEEGKVSERLGASAIAVQHSWGEVKYDAGQEFIRAHAYDSRLMRVLCGVLSESTLPHISQYGSNGTASVASSAGNLFKASVDKYLQLLTQAHPYFITTASANRAKVSDRFERDYVLNQLHYTGTSAAMNSEAVFRT